MARGAALLLLALLLPALLPHVPPRAAAEHVEVNDRTFPAGACERVCIPAIVRPRFEADPDRPDGDLVIGLALGGDARAYPVDVLVWHEVVNDVVGGQAVAITYCPLCGSSVAFGRDVAGQLLTFQTSGRLYRNDLVMRDDETGSLWPQLLGESVQGPLHGTRLDALASSLATWGEWRGAHPGSKLLARPLCNDWPHAVGGCPTQGPSLARRYGSDPYEGYAQSRRVGIGGEHRDDVSGLHPKAMVVGVALGTEAKAWDLATLAASVLVLDEVGGQPLLLTAHGGTARVFARDAAQRFELLNRTHLRDPLGQAWDMRTGQGPGGGALAPVPAETLFWFAWHDFHPGTLLHGAATVVRTRPDPGGAVGLEQALELRFSHAMDRASVEQGLALQPAHAVELAWPDAATLRVAPREPWAGGRAYELAIAGARSEQGLPLPAYQLRFHGEGLVPDLAPWGPALGALFFGGLVALTAWLAWRNRPRGPS